MCEDSRTLSVQNELLVEAENMLTAPGLEGDGRVYLLDLALKDGFKVRRNSVPVRDCPDGTLQHDILLRTGLFDSRDSRFFAKLPSLKLPNLIVCASRPDTTQARTHPLFQCHASYMFSSTATTASPLRPTRSRSKPSLRR